MTTKDLDANIIAHDHASHVFSTVSENAGKLHGRIGVIGEGLKTAAEFGGAFAAVEIFKGAFESASGYQKILAQTNAVLKSTGGAAGISTEGIKKQAEELSGMSGVQDETIQSGENLLATFTNIHNSAGVGNDIFNQATKATLDLSVALGKDMPSASILVGKALNDPIKGLTALQRVGVQFTASQRETIKHLVATGHAADAQRIILAELHTEFGGSAQAAGSTFSGSMNKLKNTFNDTARDLIAKLLPYLQQAAQWLGEYLPKAIAVAGAVFTQLKSWISPVISVIGDLIHGFSGATASSGVASGAISAVGAVFGKFRQVVVTVVDTVREWLTKNRATVSEWGAKLKQIFAMVVGVLKNVMQVVGVVLGWIEAAWKKFGPAILRYVSSTFSNILTFIKGAMGVIKGIVEVVLAIITGHWSKAWQGVKDIFAGIWQVILAAFRQVAAVLGAIWRGAVTAVIATANGLWDFFKSLPKMILDAIAGIGTWLLDAGKQLIQGLINGVKHMAGAAVDAVKNVGSSVMNGVKGFFGIHSPSTVFHEIGQHLMAGLGNGITAGGADVVDRMVAVANSARAAANANFGMNAAVMSGAGSVASGMTQLGVGMARTGGIPPFRSGASSSAGITTVHVYPVVHLDGKPIAAAVAPHLQKLNQQQANRAGVYVQNR